MKKLLVPIFCVFLFLIVIGQPFLALTATAQETKSLYAARSPIPQPYEYLTGGAFSGKEQPFSPDPLVSYRWDDPLASDELQIFTVKPISATTQTPDSFSGIETVSLSSIDIEVKGPGTLMIDFGREYPAWFEVDSPDLCGKVTFGISEFKQPTYANPPAQSISKTKAPKQYDNTYRLETNDELYEGVRFAFINVEEFDEPFHITDLRLVCQTKPVNYNGSFDSDSEMLNRIWYTAAYVVRANLRRDYFAAILNDRGDRFSWTGDAYPAQAAALVAFANYDFILQNLHYTATHSNGIESYELYWIFSLVDYYEYTGDKKGVLGLLSQARQRLDHAYQIWGKNPNLGYFGWDERLGAGFENPNIPENQNAYKMLAIRAWREFASVLEDVGEDTLAKRYRQFANQKTNELLKDPAWYESFGLHASADAMNAGVLSQDEMDKLFEKHFTDRLNRLSYSPFNEYFLLQAMANANKHDEALSSIYDMYGGMIEYGATTFFEVYRPTWNDGIGVNGAVPNCQVGFTSLAHPWGAGVLTWISEEILGIKAETAGFQTFSVLPHLGRQLTRVSGETPTPFGTIKASFDTKNGTASLSVPEGCVARIGIPKVEKKITALTMNQKALTVSDEDEDFIYIENLTGGEYVFAITYEGTTPAYEESAYVYPAKIIGVDTKTQGNWGGVYGKDGYLLCGTSNGDISHLPEYVESVQFRKALCTQWTANSDDPRALASNPYNVGKRQLGTYFTNGTEQLAQSMVVDINLKEKTPYTVALYFVDWDKIGRKLSIDVFDGDTLELIAPIQVLSDFSGGAYVLYQYDSSMRFRIHMIAGQNAVLSGIFFGEGQGSFSETTCDRLDGKDASIRYTGAWEHMNYEGWGAYQSSLSFSNQKGAFATIDFEGSGIAYITSIESNRGICEIFLDGVSQGKFDLYAPEIHRQQTVFEVSDLPEGKHTLKVVVTGEKNPSATDYYVDIDGINLYKPFDNIVTQRIDDQNRDLEYSSSAWEQVGFGGQNAFMDTISFSNRKGEYCEFTFEGTSIAYIACKEPNRGVCEIFLDGVSQGKFDCYATTMLRQQVVFAKSDLAEGTHTIRVVVTGEKNAAATDRYIDIDAFETKSLLFSLQSVTEAVIVRSPKVTDKSLTLPALPKGYTVSIVSSDHPELVALDGSLHYPEEETQVTLTLLVSHESGTKEKEVVLILPPKPHEETPDTSAPIPDDSTPQEGEGDAPATTAPIPDDSTPQEGEGETPATTAPIPDDSTPKDSEGDTPATSAPIPNDSIPQESEGDTPATTAPAPDDSTPQGGGNQKPDERSDDSSLVLILVCSAVGVLAIGAVVLIVILKKRKA